MNQPDAQTSTPRPDEAEAARLMAVAESLDLDPSDLDEAVHDTCSRRATAINNGGMDDQILFLVAEHGTREAEEIIRATVSP
ncbi:hypothetical protein OG897_32415 [Streptomyces sp. NBC_00237]|uniref:hypothetical protein n=1 Tax=Streptomyces sp. NBC_00237 TaxID=2975687 RepID=UPI00225331BC|nr:hypothetical protein [Streptomyces sp. NBC_00237]MCX5206103.1 hypothetical protein [Streptomyces sp. NBC_00237]